MEDLQKEFDNLISDTPIDDANRSFSSDHITSVVSEEVEEGKSGHLNTTKDLLTIRIKDLTVRSIKERMGRWVSRRNDVIIRAQKELNKSNASDVSQKERELVEQAEEAKSKAQEEYMANNHYSDLKYNQDQCKKLYEGMRAEMGGKPPVKPRLWLYLISIALIGCVEWFINFSTFNIKYPPGVAAGATVLIALAIAVASHFHGALIKQRVALFAPHRKKSDKNQVVYTQLIFSLLLIIALGVVTYNRYDVLEDSLVQNGAGNLPGLAGMEETATSVWSELTPFILMNILVWLVGVAISYFIHDSRPDYQEALGNYNKAKAKFFAVDKGLKEELKRIDSEFDDRIQRLKNAHSSDTNNSKDIHAYVDRLLAKEESLIKQATVTINELIEHHQSALVSSLRIQNIPDVKIGPRQLSLEEYLNTDLSLQTSDVRKMLSLENYS